jgi:succinate-semialdehyde dehydrogenase/glutarate-semialdehyde dehydrogenase
MSALVLGPGVQEGTDVGPLVNQDAVSKVDGLVRAAVQDGAKALVGGQRPQREGFYFEPTVLVNVLPGAAILGEELFGPVAPIVSFETEAQAVAFANSTEHGLVGYVYTADLARGLRVSEALEFGMVGLNRGLVSDPAAPFGGSKQSGIGSRGRPRRHARLPRVEVHRRPMVMVLTKTEPGDGAIREASRRRPLGAWPARREFDGCAR